MVWCVTVWVILCHCVVCVLTINEMYIQAESYLKQRKYKAAENMYKQILQSASKHQDHHSPSPAPAPSGKPFICMCVCARVHACVWYTCACVCLCVCVNVHACVCVVYMCIRVCVCVVYVCNTCGVCSSLEPRLRLSSWTPEREMAPKVRCNHHCLFY